jgi:hypothetical protein
MHHIPPAPRHQPCPTSLSVASTREVTHRLTEPRIRATDVEPGDSTCTVGISVVPSRSGTGMGGTERGLCWWRRRPRLGTTLTTWQPSRTGRAQSGTGAPGRASRVSFHTTGTHQQAESESEAETKRTFPLHAHARPSTHSATNSTPIHSCTPTRCPRTCGPIRPIAAVHAHIPHEARHDARHPPTAMRASPSTHTSKTPSPTNDAPLRRPQTQPRRAPHHSRRTPTRTTRPSTAYYKATQRFSPTSRMNHTHSAAPTRTATHSHVHTPRRHADPARRPSPSPRTATTR